MDLQNLSKGWFEAAGPSEEAERWAFQLHSKQPGLEVERSMLWSLSNFCPHFVFMGLSSVHLLVSVCLTRAPAQRSKVLTEAQEGHATKGVTLAPSLQISRPGISGRQNACLACAKPWVWSLAPPGSSTWHHVAVSTHMSRTRLRQAHEFTSWQRWVVLGLVFCLCVTKRVTARSAWQQL